MLKRTKGDRSLKENLLLASSTALVAGATNISGVIAFLAYSTSMTGHFANLAKNVIERNLPEVIVLLIWLLLFFAGAFAANFLVRWQSHKSVYRANALPIVLEIIILLLVAFYGRNYYAETLQEAIDYQRYHTGYGFAKRHGSQHIRRFDPHRAPHRDVYRAWRRCC